MPRMIILGRGGMLDADRVIAVVPAKSAPVKRMLDAAPPNTIIDMTYGYPRLSVAVLENGCFAIIPHSAAALAEQLAIEERMPDADEPVSW
ncbi:DUF370 domain-containing protein [Phototrophicus methaneseepsis]|uniref:DUF370 domain-containing protein n=1 Tax=Phototrophicus methaneseepsis TaxID=2710758 RepID=A0A7S8ICV8_9CHLR|nr:extracellular matrix/biofilm biosynthesis regulator RemA family protein [Phototrophicus methaneseepsis]QPC80922.1 DUF370 domain-containing protein [Phototrophicus methaneseepsis]